MRFIIFIAGRIRQGQFPRLPDFLYSEDHGKYIYQGRDLSVEEFNKAAAIVFDPHYRNNGFSFQPLVVPVVVKAAAAEEQVPATAAAAGPPVETPADAQPFIIDDEGNVFHEGARIASVLEDGTIRMARGFAPLRIQLDAWLNQSQPPTDS